MSGLAPLTRTQWAKDVARANWQARVRPRRRPDGDDHFVEFAAAATAVLVDARAKVGDINRVAACMYSEDVRPPAKYHAMDDGRSLTERIRDITVSVCIDKVRRGDVGHSWQQEFVPAAVNEAIPLIVPLFWSAIWWAVGAFVRWMLIKFVLFAVEALLKKLVGDGIASGYSTDGSPWEADPRAMIAGWAGA